MGRASARSRAKENGARDPTGRTVASEVSELGVVRQVEIAERQAGCVPRRERRCFDGLEKAPTDDFEALVRARRSPRGLHSTHDRAQASKCLTTSCPADFDVRADLGPG